jgi:starch-binding outer membrane protein, SusD/RagB family
MSNFILERLPTIAGVRASDAKELTAEAKFLRGYANFIGVYTFGGIPKVTTTTLATNRTVTRASKEEILASVLEDYKAALADLPDGDPQDRNIYAGYATKNAVRAALARYYLYQKNWTEAENYATLLINSANYSLVTFNEVVTRDYNQESIFEFGYTLNDYSGDINNYFVGRREVVPSNQVVIALTSRESGNRSQTIEFEFDKQKGNDNGWTLKKYGTADESNRNFVIFRLGEMYLIRAEARAQQGKITGTTGAIADINRLRTRAGVGLAANLQPPLLTTATQNEMISIVERERVYELAFEGHRWYDLVRTGRAQAIMSAFSANWSSKYELWPIPQSEIQRNPSLAGQQNAGY